MKLNTKILVACAVIGVLLAIVIVYRQAHNQNPAWMTANNPVIEVSSSPVPKLAAPEPSDIPDAEWEEIIKECTNMTGKVASTSLAIVYNSEVIKKVPVGNKKVYKCNGNLFVR